MGWDVLRAIEAYPEKTPDDVHFDRAAKEDRVVVTTDRRIEQRIAHAWLAQGRAFRMICWPQAHYVRMSPGDFVEALEELAKGEDPFPAYYPIVHLKAKG